MQTCDSVLLQHPRARHPRNAIGAVILASLIVNACGREPLLRTTSASTIPDDEHARLRQQRCGDVVWSADHETGDLSQWYADDGGGEFNGGTARSSATQDVARSGRHSVRTIIQAPHDSGESAVRLFRWKESRAHAEACYSAWYYFPHRYVVKEWWNIFSFKSRNATANDAFWQLSVGNRPNGAMYVYLTWWGPRIEGPQPGESGLRHFAQWLKDIPVGRWTQLQVYLRQSRGFDGQIVVWQDGVTLFNLDNVRTRYPEATGANEWSINNYSDNLDPSPTTVYIDDAAISIPAVGQTH
jgi:hypothetical protein